MKILVSDSLGAKGLSILRQEKAFQVDEKVGLKPEDLKKILPDYDAILVRSATKLTKDLLESATNLKIIGRAGVGVDNVDLPAATKRGVIVMNTPEGNTVSTCELAVSMLLALNRHIPQASQSTKAGEWKRKDFQGSELMGKYLGVVGFGRIGKEVAKRMLSFGMKILAYDPFISPDSAKGIDVEFVSFADLAARADYITIHTPLVPETKYLFNDETFKKVKPGLRIVNCARGGIIEEAALLRALEAGIVKGAALDVFEKEPPVDNPLLKHPAVVVTPHLGASTDEAQENVALAVAEQVRDYFLRGVVKNAVNLPSVDGETYRLLEPWLRLAEKLGSFQAQYFQGAVKKVTVKYSGDVTQYTLAPLTLAVLKGLLAPILGESVNYVNAPLLAKERGIEIVETKTTGLEDFAHFIELDVETEKGSGIVIGSLFGKSDSRIVRINEFYVDAVPSGYMLVIINKDMPGVVGEVGTLLGKNKINIAEMSLGRKKEGERALTVINTDSEVPKEVLETLKRSEKIIDIKLIRL
jgi:D-3-phosphoglycerate dehydrogenase